MKTGKENELNTSNSQKIKNTIPGIVLITTIFIITRVLYFNLGIRFIYPGGLETLPQLISGHLLKTDLWRSLFYLHSQPPLFNLFVGAVLQLFSGSEPLAFQIIYSIMGLLCALSMFLLMANLSVSTWISVIMTTLFIAGPSAVYYETTINYEYPVIFLLLLSALFLSYYLRGTGNIYLAGFFLMVSFLLLTRTTFQIVWLIAVLFLLLYFRCSEWKKILYICCIPVMLVLFWYVKNFVVFGQFSTSSWLGMNFSRMTMYCIPEEWRIAMVDQHEISELGRLRSIFDFPLQYHQNEKWGVPVLDDVYKMDSVNNYNYNNINIITASKQFMDDSLVVLKKYPRDYIYCTLYAQYAYFQPPFEYDASLSRAPLLLDIENIYRKVLYSSWVGDLENLTHHWREDVRAFGKWLTSSTFLFCGYILSFIFFIFYLVFCLIKRPARDDFSITLLYILLTMFYITLVCTMIDIGENFRFRFMADPFFVVVFSVALNQVIKWIFSRVRLFHHTR